jgi:hypothetical protein
VDLGGAALPLPSQQRGQGPGGLFGAGGVGGGGGVDGMVGAASPGGGMGEASSSVLDEVLDDDEALW